MQSSFHRIELVDKRQGVSAVAVVESGHPLAIITEYQLLQLFDLLHLALDVLDVGVVCALQRGQLHAVHNLESLAVILQRVCVRVLQITHVLVEEDQLLAGLVEFHGRLFELVLQVLGVDDVQEKVGLSRIVKSGCERGCWRRGRFCGGSCCEVRTAEAFAHRGSFGSLSLSLFVLTGSRGCEIVPVLDERVVVASFPRSEHHAKVGVGAVSCFASKLFGS